jgi:azurin
MNIRFPLVVSFLAVALSGCGQKDTASAPTAAATPAPTAAAPVAAATAAPRVIEITANDTMKFNLATIEAKAGETIKIVLTNNGTLPKEAMGHNLVVLKPGTDGAAFCAAAMTAKATEYVPESMKGQVVAATALLGPKKTDEIILKDLKAGEYPYVCSFPAHYAVGMKGVLIVK